MEGRLTEIEKVEEQFSLLIEQQSVILKQVSSLSSLQQDIAKQLVQQHEDVETLYLALGLKKDLSYYSFNLMDEEEH